VWFLIHVLAFIVHPVEFLRMFAHGFRGRCDYYDIEHVGYVRFNLSCSCGKRWVRDIR
jgi:hypothetical protein